MTPQEFRTEINRLYAVALDKGLMSDDVADMAGESRHTMANWILGYAVPASSEARRTAIVAIATGLDRWQEKPAGTTEKGTPNG